MNNVRVTVVWIGHPDDQNFALHVESCTYDVNIPTEEQFVQLKVNNKPITVVSTDTQYADHPDGGSMIPLVGGRAIALIAALRRPPLKRVRFVPMVHKSGRMALIKQDQRSFALI